MRGKEEPALDRVLSRVEKITESGCWIFMGALDSAGYGRIGVENRRTDLAHRVVYRAMVGPIPDGERMEIDHKCRVPSCVNPDHLRLGTHLENMMAPGSLNWVKTLAEKTHCPKGHEYTPENTERVPTRRCKTCRKEYQKRWYQRRRAVCAV